MIYYLGQTPILILTTNMYLFHFEGHIAHERVACVRGIIALPHVHEVIFVGLKHFGPDQDCTHHVMLVSSVRIPKGGRGAFASKSEVQRETLVVVAAPRELETGSRDGRVLG